MSSDAASNPGFPQYVDSPPDMAVIPGC